MKAKAILAVLLCHVLFTTQTYAISGGPGGGGGRGGFGALNTVGTYSGVLTGVQEKDPTTGITTPSSSIALFSMNVPTTNLATGTSLVFSGGRVFTGTITATVDPESGSVRGIVNATYEFSFTDTVIGSDGKPVTTTTAVTAAALGRLTAAITGTNSNSIPTGSTTAQTTVPARLAGTAQLNTNFGYVSRATLAPIVNRITTYTVDGFKQQAITSAAGTATSTTGTSSIR